jgi:DNA-binding MarR family transcriptional regulator
MGKATQVRRSVRLRGVTKTTPASVEAEHTSSPEPWLADWISLRPTIDRHAAALVGRIIRINSAFQARRTPLLASLGLTPEVSDLVISLLRIGPPHELKAGLLAQQATYPLATSGSMTYRIDRAEALGLVERVRDPNDRRGIIVRLTTRGFDVANQDVDAHHAWMRDVLSHFEPADLPEVDRLLKKLLDALSK